MDGMDGGKLLFGTSYSGVGGLLVVWTGQARGLWYQILMIWGRGRKARILGVDVPSTNAHEVQIEYTKHEENSSYPLNFC